MKGGLGLAEDPRPVFNRVWSGKPNCGAGRVTEIRGNRIRRRRAVFKTFQVRRSIDPETNVLVYTVVSTKVIGGSPFNNHQRPAGRVAVVSQ